MARPIDNELREAILSVLDKDLLVTLGQVNDHLKEVGLFKSYQSTRRMLFKMVEEELAVKHHERGSNNELFFSKRIFNPHLKLVDTSGKPVDLNHFMTDLLKMELPNVLKPEAIRFIRIAMIEYLLSSSEEAYVVFGSKVRQPADKRELRKKLEEVRKQASELHAFLTHFLKADIHSPVAENKVAKELLKMNEGTRQYFVKRQFLPPVAKNTSDAA